MHDPYINLLLGLYVLVMCGVYWLHTMDVRRHNRKISILVDMATFFIPRFIYEWNTRLPQLTKEERDFVLPYLKTIQEGQKYYPRFSLKEGYYEIDDNGHIIFNHRFLDMNMCGMRDIRYKTSLRKLILTILNDQVKPTPPTPLDSYITSIEGSLIPSRENMKEAIKDLENKNKILDNRIKNKDLDLTNGSEHF